MTRSTLDKDQLLSWQWEVEVEGRRYVRYPRSHILPAPLAKLMVGVDDERTTKFWAQDVKIRDEDVLVLIPTDQCCWSELHGVKPSQDTFEFPLNLPTQFVQNWWSAHKESWGAKSALARACISNPLMFDFALRSARAWESRAA